MQRILIYFLYRVIGLLASPLLLLYFAYRGARDRRYLEGFHERLGSLPRLFHRTASGAIWLHAVSVGEVVSAIALINEIRARFPRVEIFVSAATVAGRSLAQQRLGPVTSGVFYAPLDYVFAVRRVLRRLRPSMVIVLETEIWPNLYLETKRTGAALLVVNGRISDRAFPRYRALAWFFRSILGCPDAILAQSERDRERYMAAGASPDRVFVPGNLKYDLVTQQASPPEAVTRFIDRSGPAEVWIAASTMPPADADDVDEDDAVISAFHELARRRPRLLLLLVPRRPERFEEAAGKLQAAGVRFLRRSALIEDSRLELPGVLLVDTMGELSTLFPLAEVVFMGGTLARRGGHNILEPGFAGRPVIVGPHMENFAEIAEEFDRAGGIQRICVPAELAPAVEELLADPSRRAELGARGKLLAEAKRGVAARVVAKLAPLYEAALPRYLPPSPVAVALRPAAWIWARAARWNRRRQTARVRRLETPVISVGGITAGGSGKTPFVLWLAERLHRPAILTRGYRRRSAEPHVLLPAGAEAAAEITGDEAQIFLRLGRADIGIGADRYETGRLLEQRFRPDVILLDDGFQHVRLARQLDIVMIDALDPFGGGALLPLGRLREPLDALAHADIFVIMRAERGRSYEAIERVLRRYNRDAPVFHARVTPGAWIDAATGDTAAIAGPVAAFCGLGNPDAFRRTLQTAGVNLVSFRSFSDHHRYSRRDLERLWEEARAAGASALVTTEKDVMNFPDRSLTVAAPIYWLQTTIEVDREAELLAAGCYAENSGYE